MVLLGLVTGKPLFSNGKKVTHITKEVQTKIEREDIADIADPRLYGSYDLKSMRHVIEIALSCTSISASNRPRMTDVAAQLRECLRSEMPGEFQSDTSSATFSVYDDNSTARASPSAGQGFQCIIDKLNEC